MYKRIQRFNKRTDFRLKNALDIQLKQLIKNKDIVSTELALTSTIGIIIYSLN